MRVMLEPKRLDAIKLGRSDCAEVHQNAAGFVDRPSTMEEARAFRNAAYVDNVETPEAPNQSSTRSARSVFQRLALPTPVSTSKDSRSV